jgi:hypothetical protein
MSPLKIEEGIPKMRKPLPKETKVFLVAPAARNAPLIYERSPVLITRALEKALKTYNINYVVSDSTKTKEEIKERAIKEKCDVILYVKVGSWGYANAGFSGFGERNEIELEIMIAKVNSSVILQRATVLIVNKFGHDRNLNATADTTAEILNGFVVKFFDVDDSDRNDK